MRRFLPSVLAPIVVVILLMATACGDDGASSLAEAGATTTTTTSTTTLPPVETAAPTTGPPPTTTDPAEPVTTLAPDDDADGDGGEPLVDLIAAVGNSIELVEPTLDLDVKTTFLFNAGGEVSEIRQASDGTIVTHESVDPAAPNELVVARYDSAGNRTVIEGAERLYDVAMINGVESIIVKGPAGPGGDGLDVAEVLAVPLAGGASTSLGPASDIEFGVGNVDVFGGVAVLSASADLTEVVYYEEVGGVAPPFSPTDDLPYGEPPYVTAATFSFDGSRLYWAEGPDWGFIESDNEFGPVPAIWEVFGADPATGEISLVWPVSGMVESAADLEVVSIADVGTHLIINRRMFADAAYSPLAPMILDFTFEEPVLWELPLVAVVTAAATS